MFCFSHAYAGQLEIQIENSDCASCHFFVFVFFPRFLLLTSFLFTPTVEALYCVVVQCQPILHCNCSHPLKAASRDQRSLTDLKPPCTPLIFFFALASSSSSGSFLPTLSTPFDHPEYCFSLPLLLLIFCDISGKESLLRSSTSLIDCLPQNQTSSISTITVKAGIRHTVCLVSVAKPYF